MRVNYKRIPSKFIANLIKNAEKCYRKIELGIGNVELGIKGSVLHPKSSLCQREDLGGNVKMKNKDKKDKVFIV